MVQCTFNNDLPSRIASVMFDQVFSFPYLEPGLLPVMQVIPMMQGSQIVIYPDFRPVPAMNPKAFLRATEQVYRVRGRISH